MPSSVTAIVSRTRTRNFLRVTDPSGGPGSIPTPAIQIAEPDGMVKVNEYVTAELMFFGTDADGETFTFDVYGIRLVGGDPKRTDHKGGLPFYIPYLLGAGTGILGSQVGIASAYLEATDFFADTLTFTPNAAFGAYFDDLTGKTPVVYSPADNSRPALLAFHDLLNFYGLVIDLDVGTAADASCLISLWT